MTSPLLSILSQNSAPPNSASNNTQPSFGAGGIPDFGGQSSFLSLLLGQIGEGNPVDLESLNINFSDPSARQSGFHLNSAVGENLGSLNVGDNILQRQNAAIANNQGRIQEYSQKLREFLASLIEQAQGSVPQAEVINEQLSEFIRANNTAAGTINTGADNASSTGNLSQAQQALIFNISNLAEQAPEAFIQQAALLSSGVSINDLNKIQAALDQLDPQTAEAIKLGLAGNILGNGQGKNAAELAPIFANAEGIAKANGQTSSRNSKTGDIISSLLSGARNAASSATGADAASNASGANAAAAQAGAQTSAAQQNSILSSFFSFAQFVAQDNGLYTQAAAGQPGDQLANQALQAGADVTAARNIVNPQVSVAHASMPHPASESLAVQIQRFAKANGDSRFSIEMDPPELGRVEVDIKFGGDKNMVTVQIERPETYMMLQRDAGVLQKALQEMGIDLQGNDLSFNLAQQDSSNGGDASNGQNGSRSHNDGYAGFNDGKPSEIIEAQMTQIYVDPRTGMVRLNITA